ncbi:MAG: TetR family transcriptional regulator, partial [Lachnospiraceae bacterium]
MSRNKYPEETVKLILEESLKLFIEKGYESTSIQDIINHLGGLS